MSQFSVRNSSRVSWEKLTGAFQRILNSRSQFSKLAQALVGRATVKAIERVRKLIGVNAGTIGTNIVNVT